MHMGQKINPIIFRIGTGFADWKASWTPESMSEYGANVVSDIKMLRYITSLPESSSIGDVVISRKTRNPKVAIYVPRAGAIIGKKRGRMEQIVGHLSKLAGNKNVYVNLEEVKKPSLDALLVARSLAKQIEKRSPYRRIAKGAVESALRDGALGARVTCSGRLNGADIARSESFKCGTMPLHSMSAKIDYAVAHAITTYGAVGIKVWINRRF